MHLATRECVADGENVFVFLVRGNDRHSVTRVIRVSLTMSHNLEASWERG